jgi:hypothetical protein
VDWMTKDQNSDRLGAIVKAVMNTVSIKGGL